MPDTIAFPPLQRPTAEQPLAGLTVLVVEDSRYACEALRLLCQHSGARLRRADSLAAAHRHLRIYRPDVLIVDLGLPDGPGEGLIAALAPLPARPEVILGLSGDPGLASAALAAGADGFIGKPLPGLLGFQQAVLAHLPEQARQLGPRPRRPEPLPEPDPIALRDDLALASDILSNRPDAPARAYLSRFLSGVARSARDRQLEAAAAQLGQEPAEGAEESPAPGTAREAELGHIARLVRARLATGSPLWIEAPRPGTLHRGAGTLRERRPVV